MSVERVTEVFEASSAAATKVLYAEIEALGPIGVVAINLLRACKANGGAKLYRGSSIAAAYDKKAWAIGQATSALLKLPPNTALWPAAPKLWGWGVDEAKVRSGSPHASVIYFDLPTGQVSFHMAYRTEGPAYGKPWDRAIGTGPARVCRWAGLMLAGEPMPELVEIAAPLVKIPERLDAPAPELTQASLF